MANMAIIPLQCTKCGANLEINDTLEKGYCNYCGQMFLVSDALKHKQVIDESHKLAPLLELAEAELKARNFAKCSEHCNEAILIDPKNHRAWYIKGCAAECVQPGSGKSFFDKAKEYGGNYKYAGRAAKRILHVTAPKMPLIQPFFMIYLNDEVAARIKGGETMDLVIPANSRTLSVKLSGAIRKAWTSNIPDGVNDLNLTILYDKSTRRYNFCLDKAELRDYFN